MLPDEATADFHALAGLAWYAQRKPVFTGGNRVRLLQGGVERIQGHALGQLLLGGQ